MRPMNTPASSPVHFGHQGRVVLITGGAQGIGEACARRFAREDANVVLVDLADARGRALATALGATYLHGDVGHKPDVDAAVARTLELHGRIDVLVNNAGITRDMLAMRLKDEDWDAVLDTNLKAVFCMSRAVMRTMMKQRYGRIVNITSVVGASGNPGQSNYAAAKAGVAGMTRALARELGSRGITVNCIAPGFIETDMTGKLSSEQQAALLGQIPLGHLGKPSDVAHAVAYLASPEAAYVTGQELHVNGGMYM